MSKLVKRRQIEGAISNFEYIEMRTKQIAKLNELDSHYAPSIFNSSELLQQCQLIITHRYGEGARHWVRHFVNALVLVRRAVVTRPDRVATDMTEIVLTYCCALVYTH